MKRSPFQSKEDARASVYGGQIKSESPEAKQEKKSSAKNINVHKNTSTTKTQKTEIRSIRVPHDLLHKFDLIYHQSAAKQLEHAGKKTRIQDCYAEMFRDWIEKKKRELSLTISD